MGKEVATAVSVLGGLPIDLVGEAALPAYMATGLLRTTRSERIKPQGGSTGPPWRGRCCLPTTNPQTNPHVVTVVDAHV